MFLAWWPLKIINSQNEWAPWQLNWFGTICPCFRYFANRALIFLFLKIKIKFVLSYQVTCRLQWPSQLVSKSPTYTYFLNKFSLATMPNPGRLSLFPWSCFEITTATVQTASHLSTSDPGVADGQWTQGSEARSSPGNSAAVGESPPSHFQQVTSSNISMQLPFCL
jgi:hypothetical protein